MIKNTNIRPTLGVIIPNYNHAKFIGRAIDAIARQSRQPDQLIIVDDGSTDNSVEVIERHIAGLSFVDFIKLPYNTKLSGARTQAFECLHTDYVYNAAADDFILPGFFEKAMEMAVRYPQAGLIFGNFVCVDKKGEIFFRTKPPVWETALYASPKKFLKEYIEPAPPTHSQSGATIYRTDILREQLPYPRELFSWSDTFSNWKIGLSHGCCFFPHDCMVWNIQPDSCSSRTASNPFRMLDICINGAGLMCSEQYSHLFPEDFVLNWFNCFRESIITMGMETQKKYFDAVFCKLKGNIPNLIKQKHLFELINKIVSLFQKTDAYFLKKKMEAYRAADVGHLTQKL